MQSKEIFMSVEQDKKDRKKGFWSRLLDSLDRKLEAKAKSSGNCCCAPGGKSDKKTCC
jgi:hypothetical protein